VGSTTGAQLLLTDARDTTNPWFFRTINGHLYIGTSSPSTFATTTYPTLTLLASSTVAAFVGIGTSSPSSQLDVAGEIKSCESTPATSTSMIIDWSTTCNQVNIRLGSAAMTVSFVNYFAGEHKMIVVSNPANQAGAITFNEGASIGVHWMGGTAPLQTTATSSGDIYSFTATIATTTTIHIQGVQSPAIQ